MKFCKKCGTETERYRCGQCRPCVLARSNAWSAANREQDKVKSLAYKRANPDKIKAASARYGKKHRERLNQEAAAYRAAYPEKVRRIKAVWDRANPEYRAVRSNIRRARKRAVGGKHTIADIKALFVHQRGTCVYCKVSIEGGYHVDHIMPLARGGSNDKSNIQLLCPTCNLRKSAKHPLDFARSMGLVV